MRSGVSLFLGLPTPAQRVEVVEITRKSIRKWRAAQGETPTVDLPLSQPSITWLKRMRAALCDDQVSQKSLDELTGVLEAYRETIDRQEAAELGRRLLEFGFAKKVLVAVPEFPKIGR